MSTINIYVKLYFYIHLYNYQSVYFHWISTMSSFSADQVNVEAEAIPSRDVDSVTDTAASRFDAMTLGPRQEEEDDEEGPFEDAAEGYDREDIIVRDDSAEDVTDDVHRSIEEATAAKEEGNK
jgi:hypothetical protein